MKSLMGLITANYTEGNFGTLTQDRPVASLPFGGRYRLIDFPLSNMVNSGIHSVGLITPYMYRSLMDHVGVGKEWALSRKLGGLYFLPGTIYGLKSAHSKFLLRDIIQNKAYLERGRRDRVLICDSSKIYNIDFSQVEQAHIESGADVTLIYKKKLIPDETKELYLEVNGAGKVTDIQADPNAEANCFIDAMIIGRELLLNMLDWYEPMSYMDLMDVLSENLDKMNIQGYAFDGYVGVINNLKGYMNASQDLLKEDVRTQLFRTDRPIATKVQDSPPAKYMPSAKISSSLISSGSIIEGTVENSIIFRDVHVAKGAVVRNCVIMQKSVVGENAVLENIVCDKYATIKAGVKLYASSEAPIAISKKEEV